MGGRTASAAQRAAPDVGELPTITDELLADLKPLQARRRTFLLLLLGECRGNATEAYRKAYNATQKVAEASASRLLRDVKVSAILSKYRQRQEQSLALTAAEIDAERRRIARNDPRKLCAPDGRPLGLHELDEDTARAVSKVKFKVARVVRGVEAVKAAAEAGVPDPSAVQELTLGTVEYAFHSKNEALSAADKVLGRHIERHEFVGPQSVSINIGVRRKAKPTTGEK